MLTLTKDLTNLNGAQLESELRAAGYTTVRVTASAGGGSVDVYGQNAAGNAVGESDRSPLQAVVTAHVPDPNFGATPDEIAFREYRTASWVNKARAVRAGTDTFTAAQVQKILAELMLRAIVNR